MVDREGFKHLKTDVVITCRFRNDVWKFLETKMCTTTIRDHPGKSIHTVLDEQLREVIKK